ncbi:MAG: hypothetical protein IJ053_03750 [Lachnospiraceae bacterium]|nr:hypothetical protein [Lachnospiraceae bacterium]
MFNKYQKGEYGYMNSYKKSKLIISLIFAAMISFIIITMLIMYGSTQRIMIIFAIILVLPFSKFLISYIMCMTFKPIDKETYEYINDKTASQNGTLLYDVVITETAGMKFYQSICVSDGRIYAYIEDKKYKTRKNDYIKWIKNCISGTKFSYTIYVTDDKDEYIKKVNSVSKANEKNERIDNHIVERILVTCV